MEFPNRVERVIYLNNIVRNYEVIRAQLSCLYGSRAPKMAAVLKEDALALGIGPVASSLASSGVSTFCVSSLEDGAKLRSVLPYAEILLIAPWFPDVANLLVKYSITPFLSNKAQTKALNKVAEGCRLRHNCYIEIDVGMARGGTKPEELPEAMVRIQQRYPHIHPVAFAVQHPDPADKERTRSEWTSVVQMRNYISDAHKWLPIQAGASSAALLCPATPFPDAGVRVGRPLMGIASPELQSGASELTSRLCPALELRTRVFELRKPNSDGSCGYGPFKVPKSVKRLAVVTAGFAGGYPSRRVCDGHRGAMLLRGRRVNILATMMNHTLLDATEIPNVTTNDEVILVGKQAEYEITMAEAAENNGVSISEWLLSLARTPRIYIS